MARRPRRRTSTRRAQPAQPRVTEPRPNVPRATEPGTCLWCPKPITVGQVVGDIEGRVGHAACVQAVRAELRRRAPILAEETFRGHQSSGWKRGASPSSLPETRR